MKYQILCLFFSTPVALALGIPPKAEITQDLTVKSRSSHPSLANAASAHTSPVVSSATRITPFDRSREGSNVALTFDLPKCHDDYGKGLNQGSCSDAWRSIPIDIRKNTYGRRTEGVYDVPLPRRYLSGECCSREG